MSHLPRVEITCVLPRDYPVNLALARANNSSTLTINFDFFVSTLVWDIFKTKLLYGNK